MSKKISWKEILDRFKKFSDDELNLPVLTGGNGQLYGFKGFGTIGCTSDKTMSGREVLFLLSGLDEETLNKEVPHLEYEDKFNIGISRVFIAKSYWKFDKCGGILDDDEENYDPMQDYLGDELGSEPGIDKVNRDFKEQARTYKACYYEPTEHILIDPGKVIIIEIFDGDCLTDDSDALINFDNWKK